MRKLYQRVILFLIIIGGISGTVIYFTVDINTLRHFDLFQPWSIFIALLFIALGLFFDGTRLMHLVYISGEKITLSQAVQVIFGNYFLALVTPGAAGGAVAQLMFLRNAGVPTGKATVLVVVRTLLSILFLVVCLPIILYLDPGLIPFVSKTTLLVVSLSIVCISFGGIWFMRTSYPDYIVIFFTKKLGHDKRRAIFKLYRDVRGAVYMLSSAPLSMLRVFFESGLSLLSLYMVVPVLFAGLGISVDWFLVLGRMIFLNFLLYFAPTPGGSGVAEGGFVYLFSAMLPPGTVGIMAVAWRALAEYIPFTIGLYYTVRIFGEDILNKSLEKGE